MHHNCCIYASFAKPQTPSQAQMPISVLLILSFHELMQHKTNCQEHGGIQHGHYRNNMSLVSWCGPSVCICLSYALIVLLCQVLLCLFFFLNLSGTMAYGSSNWPIF